MHVEVYACAVPVLCLHPLGPASFIRRFLLTFTPNLLLRAGVGRTGWHIDGSFQPAPFAYSLYHMVSIPRTVRAPAGSCYSAAQYALSCWCQVLVGPAVKDSWAFGDGAAGP